MSSLFVTLLLAVISWRVPALPLLNQPVYLSAISPRADTLFVSEADATPPQKLDARSLGPRLSAKSALVVDRATGAILFENNSTEQRSLASLSKLMTALTFLEAKPDLTLPVAMTADDDREGGQTFIRPGESATLADYLATSLIASANNATIVLSRSAGMSKDDFVKAMNAKAIALGMYQTVFIDPAGLEVGNQGTARDMVLLLRAAAGNDLIRQFTTTAQTSITVYPPGETREVKSTDHLLGSIVNITLAKTGYLDEALYNLAAIARLKNGREVYAIVLGAASSDERFQDVKNLAVWSEETYQWK